MSVQIYFAFLFKKLFIIKLPEARFLLLESMEGTLSLISSLLFAIPTRYDQIIFNMSVMKARLVLSREQVASSRQDLSISRTDQQDCSVSSIKSNSELRDLVSILKEFVEISKHKMEGEERQEGGSEVEPRDRPVIVNLPQELSHGALERFMTKLCGEVWSRAFHYYSTNQLSFENTKIYSSQQILQNLARLCEKHPLTAHHFAVIDHHLQGSVLEYMLQKYPMTLSQEINRNLNNAIRQIDDADSPAHDFLHKSNFTFKYRETGEYNDLIMRTINEAINRIQARSDNQSVYERFEDNMTLLFESVSNYEWMHKSTNGKDGKDGKLDSKGEEEQAEGHWLLTLTLNNSLQRKMTMDGETLRSQYIKMKEKEKSSYEEKVKQYTHYKINKKLPQSARIFTQEEIASHRLKIESPQILRILTKWCSELEKKFEGPDCFQHFVRGVSLEKSANLTLLLGQVRDSLSELIRQEKARIQKELAELAGNNFSMQSELLRQKLAGAEFSQVDRYQRISAQFSIDIVNNLHSYIIAYLNRLIHGLLAVWRRFQKLPGVEQLELTGGAGIVSFQVMDLVRCKCASREKEILRIYHQLLRMCEVKSNMSLVRVVNRLRRGTNDILINVMYRDVLCEIQLAVTNKENTFLEYSNAFNHYLYELKRSVFGPLTQLAGIWKNLDARFNIYKGSGGVASNQQDSLWDSVRIVGAHGCGGKSGFVAYNRPFICSQCSKHYFHNKFVKKHIKCAACDFWLCARCQIKDSDCLQLLTAAFHNQEVARKCKRLDKNTKTLPNYGMCIYIESQEIVVEPFRKYTSDKCTEKIMGIKNKCIYQIYDTSTQRQRSKFMSKFLIFEMEEEFGSRAIKISNQAVRHYLIEEKIKHTLAKNKDAVSLNNEGLTDQQLHALTSIANQQQRSRIKAVQLMGNRLTTTAALEQFPNVLKVELSKNRITDFSALKDLRKLQRVALSDNDLKQFPQELCAVPSLREITINENAIKSIPAVLRQCSGLVSLHFTSNKLTQLPSFLFELPHLAELSATSNFIKEIPQAIQLARRLKHLSIQNNYIKAIPREVEFLVDLQRLNLSYNKIAQLPPLGSLRSLKHLNLRHNSLTNIEELLVTPMNIRQMDLSYNSIKTASSFDNHHLLKFLNLSHNQITNFPVFTRTCANLKHLLLSSNKMTVMGTLEHLLSLQELDLSNNSFQAVHTSLPRLANLVVVHLEGNQLNSFSDVHMEQIVKLFLRRNRITEMRKLHMRHLEELDVSENELTCFEGNFLPKLKKLNLNINQLHQLELGSYLKISVVQAARNQLRHVPTLHPSNQLKFLNLEHNCIQEIPKLMLSSSHINTLNLSNNRIKVIPRELQNLSTLKQKSLFLQKNPLEVVECPHFISNKCGYDITNDINASRAEAPPQEKLEGSVDLLFSQTHPIMPP